MSADTKLRPVIDGPWWVIGPSPDLSAAVDGNAEHRLAFEKHRANEHNAPVDHHIVRDAEGMYHLWGCVRSTAVGRILYHWTTDDLAVSPWTDSGEFIRADRDAGESIDDWFGQEWLQSPYFVQYDGTYHMFYGAHRAGVDAAGRTVKPADTDDSRLGRDGSLFQICLMTSRDGRRWTRHRNPDGTSRLFLGPGETRDPCVLRIGDTWHMYYAGYYDFERSDEGAGFVVRTSKNLIDWSDWRLVHRDPSYGAGRWDTECPFVIEKEGYFYLFRTADYYRGETFVFRSKNPFDFGIGDAADNFVCRIACAAPELYEFDGQEYLSSSHSPHVGELMCRLRWVEDEE